ncbi:Acetate kinase [bioreactor metagenome]|uniref:Acetate kinase n=1 Tax=bioreactor metagenome TaxID=1076179 RepID=A0A645J5W0_9ZZZZ
MGGLDAIAFTGGIGENSAEVRAFVMQKLAFLGMVPSSKPAPRGEICCITAPESKVAAWVIPANEELGIARLTASAIM